MPKVEKLVCSKCGTEVFEQGSAERFGQRLAYLYRLREQGYFDGPSGHLDRVRFVEVAGLDWGVDHACS